MSGSFTNENTFSYNARSSHHYTTNKQDDVVILYSHAQSKVWRQFLKNDPTELLFPGRNLRYKMTNLSLIDICIVISGNKIDKVVFMTWFKMSLKF